MAVGGVQVFRWAHRILTGDGVADLGSTAAASRPCAATGSGTRAGADGGLLTAVVATAHEEVAACTRRAGSHVDARSLASCSSVSPQKAPARSATLARPWPIGSLAGRRVGTATDPVAPWGTARLPVGTASGEDAVAVNTTAGATTVSTTGSGRRRLSQAASGRRAPSPGRRLARASTAAGAQGGPLIPAYLQISAATVPGIGAGTAGDPLGSPDPGANAATVG